MSRLSARAIAALLLLVAAAPAALACTNLV